MTTKRVFLLLMSLLVAGKGSSQTVFPLWPAGQVPNALPNDTIRQKTDRTNGILRISQVTEPTLTAYLPKARKRTGGAVLIIPGGGYWVVAADHEGKAVAEWANRLGMVAFVLIYRLPDARLWREPREVPLQDARQAMRLIREGAGRWGIDPNKVGVLGFSAGGHLASTLCTHDATTPAETGLVRPSWAVLGYPVITFGNPAHPGSRQRLLGPDQQNAALITAYSNETRVTNATPPTFLFHATDDGGVPVANSLLYYEALVKAKVPAELHVFRKGGHGFGMGKPHDGAAGAWPALCADWLRALQVTR